MIDVIIPTIDSPKLLKRALSSLAKTQECQKITVYIINDNSEHDEKNYLEIIQQFPNLNCVYKKLEKRSGPGPARNAGIKLGKNPFITFLDTDDEFQDNVLKYCDNNSDAIITEPIDFGNKVQDSQKILTSIHGMILKRSFLEKNKLYFPKINKHAEDTIFRLMIFSFAKNIKRFEMESFYKYNDNPNSNFLHSKPRTFLFDSGSTEQQEIDNTVWFSIIINYLKNIKFKKTSQQSFIMLKTFLAMKKTINTKEIFILFSYLVKKHIDFKQLSQEKIKLEKEELILLYIINNWFYIENNYLIFKPDQDFKNFILSLQDDIPLIISNNFITNFNHYYEIDRITSHFLTFYYH